MRTWFVKVAVPLWATLYFVIFYLFGVSIFFTLKITFGVWLATLIFAVFIGVWGVIFYIILLQSDSFEHFRDSTRDFLAKRHGRVFGWIRIKYFAKNDHSPLSPVLIMLIFVIANPLVGVPLIRYSYQKIIFWKGFFWIWVGAFAKVMTWYLPLYGGGLSIIMSVLPWH